MQSIRREKGILWGLVGQVFPELIQVFKDLEGETCRALLMTCAAAATIRQMSVEAFLRQVRTAYSGKRLFISKLKCGHTNWRPGRSASPTAYRLFNWPSRCILPTCRSSETQLEKVTCAMTACGLSSQKLPICSRDTCLKPVSAALFLAEVGDPYRYQAAAQWVKLAGIQPAPNTSGKKQRSRTPMSHQGRARLRTLLYFTCLRLVQSRYPLRTTLFSFAKEAEQPTHQNASPGCAHEQTFAYLVGAHSQPDLLQPILRPVHLKTASCHSAPAEPITLENWHCLATRGHRTTP